MKIKEVSEKESLAIIDQKKPIGLFLSYSQKSKVWAAIDNRKGRVWTEDFKDKELAKEWLKSPE